MKKIFQKIKLRPQLRSLFEDSDNLLKDFSGRSWMVLFHDNTWEHVYFKDDLIRLIEQDHRRPISRIVDSIDCITLDRDVQVDASVLED